MTKEQILSNYQPIPYCGCWIWDGCINNSGYGAVRYEGKTQRVHRVMYELSKGQIPKGMHVLHQCDTRCCVNPDHLFLGTNKDNIEDCISKGRRGCSNKLSTEDVTEIKMFLANGIKQTLLAKMYGVAASSISQIYTGETWGGVE